MRKLVFTLSAVLLLLVNTMAQTRVITGKVSDDKGVGIPRASVQVKGSRIGTATNNQGEYTLNIPENASTLVISSVNMTPVEVDINSGNLNVSLVPNAIQMSDVVVTVPYGTIKKTAFTGSENTVTAATITKRAVTDVSRTLEGLIPGIIATNGGGAPGSGAAIRIRGIGSVNSNSAPLYVLNGTPYDGDISAISNDDIETVTVLKDAAASALYGSRAANGVIMITTKRGKRGKPMVSATVRQGFMSRGIPEYDRVGPKEYYELFWEAYRNSYVASGSTAAAAGIAASNVLTGPNGLVYNSYNVPGNKLVDSITGKLNPNASLLWNESWEEALFRQASRTNVNFNISGAGENMDYFLSAGYLNEDGIVRNSGYKRYNFRVNINAAATKWLNTGINLDGAVAKQRAVPSGGTATTNPFYFTRQMAPIYPVYQHNLVTGAFIDSLGAHKYDFGIPTQMGTRPYAPNSNVRATLDLDDRSSDIFNGNANAYAEIKFLRNFSFKATLGLNYYSDNNTNYQNNQYGDAAPAGNPPATWGRSTKSNNRQLSLTGNEILTWDKSFGRHHVRALAGHENYKLRLNSLSANSAGFLFPGQTELNNGAAAFGAPTSSEDNVRIESYLANVNYDYDNKYLLSGSYRTDGSSKFSPESRWGDFFSVGAGWRVSEEKFLDNVKWLNELKLRASYGETGNEGLLDNGNPLYYGYIAYYYANPGTGAYITPTRPGSPDLTWESNNTTNIGIDFTVFKNRLTGTFEWFKKITDGLLFDVQLNPAAGSTSAYRNAGTLENKGMELSLGYNAVRKTNFNWRIDLNLTRFTNTVKELPTPKQNEVGFITGTKKLLPGKSIFDFWLPEFAGVDPSNGDALWYRDILDAAGNVTSKTITNTYSNASFYYHGSALPKFSGGLTNSFNFKGFDLSFLLTFAYGGKFYDGNYATIMHRGSAGIALHTDMLNRWQKPGDVTNIPRLHNAVANQEGASSRWLVDASYLNIKNITLAYNLSSALASRLNLSGLQVFINVDNAWLFTAKKGMDPQRAFNGTADATYTPFRTISTGFTVNLQ